MDAFVQRLILRLCHPSQPLSRNRHFHTFDTPEGRLALKTARRLKSLQRDLIAFRQGGGTPAVEVRADGDRSQVEIRMEDQTGRRLVVLNPDEFQLLQKLYGTPSQSIQPSNM